MAYYRVTYNNKTLVPMKMSLREKPIYGAGGIFLEAMRYYFAFTDIAHIDQLFVGDYKRDLSNQGAKLQVCISNKEDWFSPANMVYSFDGSNGITEIVPGDLELQSLRNDVYKWSVVITEKMHAKQTAA